MSSTSAREDRIELRATKEEKRILAAAAAYERLDVTSFIMRSVLPAARGSADREDVLLCHHAQPDLGPGCLDNGLHPETPSQLLSDAQSRPALTTKRASTMFSHRKRSASGN